MRRGWDFSRGPTGQGRVPGAAFVWERKMGVGKMGVGEGRRERERERERREGRGAGGGGD